MRGFRDIHAHFVYGVDDGAQTREEMEAMLDAAHAQGIVSLFSTPHVTPGVKPFDEQTYRLHLEQARAYCRQKGYVMRLHSGAEIMYTPAIERSATERTLPSLAHSQYVLMEFVPDITYTQINGALELMERCGYVTILAHMERYACMYHSGAYRLKEQYDIRYQINCGTVIDGRGFLRDRTIHKWLRDGLIDFVATDMHDCRRRPPRMRKAFRTLLRSYDRDLVVGMMGLR